MEIGSLVPKADPDPSLPNTYSHRDYEHLHFDLNGDGAACEEALEPWRTSVDSQDGFYARWDLFRRPTDRDLAAEFQRHGLRMDDSAAELLCDPMNFGAPDLHLTFKYLGAPRSPQHERFYRIADQGIRLVSQLPVHGYVEMERVTVRMKIDATRAAPNPGAVVNPPPFSRFQMVDLARLNRKFRQTEIHVTFEELGKVNPVVLMELYRRGFYTAYKHKKRGWCALATIQGFDPEITLILAQVLPWLQQQVSSGSCASDVTVKKEDITGFTLLGDDPKLQKVVNPGTLFSSPAS
jgi:hypothetical protein